MYLNSSEFIVRAFFSFGGAKAFNVKHFAAFSNKRSYQRPLITEKHICRIYGQMTTSMCNECSEYLSEFCYSYQSNTSITVDSNKAFHDALLYKYFVEYANFYNGGRFSKKFSLQSQQSHQRIRSRFFFFISTRHSVFHHFKWSIVSALIPTPFFFHSCWKHRTMTWMSPLSIEYSIEL